MNRRHKGWQHEEDVSFICAPEGVYAMRTLPEPIMSQLDDIPKDLPPRQLKDIFSEWYYDIADAVAIYNGGRRLLKEMRRLQQSPVPAEQAYATQMIERYKEHAGDRRQFLDDMQGFGFDVEFQPWGPSMEFQVNYQPSNEVLKWTPNLKGTQKKEAFSWT